MFYYSKNSKMKVFHTGKCRHFHRINENNIRVFADAFEGKQAGYTYCPHCCPMKHRYEKELYDINDFSKNHRFKVELVNGELIIETPFSEWKLICIGDFHRLALYHRNTTIGNSKGPMAGYHEQNYKTGSIKKYLRYILSHDDYRRQHPIGTYQPPKRICLPEYYKKQKHRSNKSKRRAKQSHDRYIERERLKLAEEEFYQSEYANIRIG